MYVSRSFAYNSTFNGWNTAPIYVALIYRTFRKPTISSALTSKPSLWLELISVDQVRKKWDSCRRFSTSRAQSLQALLLSGIYRFVETKPKLGYSSFQRDANASEYSIPISWALNLSPCQKVIQLECKLCGKSWRVNNKPDLLTWTYIPYQSRTHKKMYCQTGVDVIYNDDTLFSWS